jgi:hypothetical protein
LAIYLGLRQLLAEQIADRVLLLAEGRALAFGTLAELKAWVILVEILR